MTVKGDHVETVANNETVTIAGNRTETVGQDETITVGGNRTETVSNDENIKVGGNRTETVSSNETVEVGGALGVRAGGALNLDGSFLGLNASAACMPVARVGDIVDPMGELIASGSPASASTERVAPLLRKLLRRELPGLDSNQQPSG